MSELSDLARHVVTLGEKTEETVIQLAVLESAVLALIASSPNPAGFAAQFRRYWQLLGSPHSASESGEVTLGYIDEYLSRIEEASPVPLEARPPKV